MEYMRKIADIQPLAASKTNTVQDERNSNKRLLEKPTY